MKLPARMFWTTYRGMAVFGSGCFVVGCTAATAMLVFRRSIEPFMPLVLSLFAQLVSHGRVSLHYRPELYPWTAGFLYFVSALCLAVTGYVASQKPEEDRRIDDYLRREMQIDRSRVEPSSPPRDR